MVKLDILSDPICPWCYIGKTQLDRALESAGNPFQIEWHPFQLNPDMPPEGMERAVYLEAKFGDPTGAQAYEQIAEHAKMAGLEIDFAALPRVPNTIDAHRLIHWAGIEQRQSLVVQRLFEAYFRDHRDIGEHDVLADIADGAEMDAGVVMRLLASDADVEDIRKRDAHSREMGVTGVPTFIVGQRHAVPGAQPPELWAKVISEIEAGADFGEEDDPSATRH
ncbi:DsbA family oxidoreductase [Histidinibacterium aquaticum]|uniref:DsbA family oxidoreductase n=1 Tax=Histidinibacterium aquaticum TaxID=2613962 RepID=A0A5J5GNZ0_9RHOB|nr:DsbA family oxidoreductase [Histidinibacterium aquaticum]KAA9009162.1 DsbA family oxidoreductase [Histidinibacterium aquaticum]